MMDVIFVAVVIAFFSLSAGLVFVCERLRRRGS
jgi:hypothetical protein